MTADASTTVAGFSEGVEGPVDRPRRQKRRAAIAAVLVVAGAGAALGVANPISSRHRPAAGVADNTVATSLATVTRRSLAQQTSVSATLGYAGSYSVINHAQGTITDLPAAGAVVHQGESLYSVDDSPVVVLYGATPLYRDLSSGMTGADVEELNADLVALGYATTSELSPTSDEFNWETQQAVEDLQAALGVTETGTVTQAQFVVVPTAVRVTTLAGSLDGPAQTGQPLLTATSTDREVTVALDASLQSQVKVGDRVTITLPNQQTTPGVVTSVGTVATAPSQNQGSGGSNNSNPTVNVEVRPLHPAATGSIDQAPVEVAITDASVDNALVVPVDALLALSGGGYAVEVVDPQGVHNLIPVTMGIFDDADSLVQVTGSGLSAGQRVVVPSS